jgi:predicted cupin superfamily sugar epimerase
VLSAEAVVALLGLAPHPEGGHYRETFRDAAPVGGGARGL